MHWLKDWEPFTEKIQGQILFKNEKWRILCVFVSTRTAAQFLFLGTTPYEDQADQAWCSFRGSTCACSLRLLRLWLLQDFLCQIFGTYKRKFTGWELIHKPFAWIRSVDWTVAQFIFWDNFILVLNLNWVYFSYEVILQNSEPNLCGDFLFFIIYAGGGGQDAVHIKYADLAWARFLLCILNGIHSI